MDPRKDTFETLCKGIIKKLEARQMEGRFFATAEECRAAILELIPEGATVATGGAETLKEIGIRQELESGRYDYISRADITDAASRRAHYGRVATCDWFLMSTNAMTMDGLLVNIDGHGTRVAYLIHGPENVIVVVGKNKLTLDLDSAIKRARNIAAPINSVRLERNTPCTKAGRCMDCLAADCICSQMVVTRRSHVPGRIKVFLVAEDLGF